MLKSTSSGRLRRKIELVLSEYAAPGRLLLEHPRARQLYPPYLSVIYYLPRTGTSLMQTALDRALELSPGDPIAAGLVPYLAQHIEEERHGEEPGAGALADLGRTGFDTLALQDRLPPPKIAALIGAQYFWIRHMHPVALLGYLEVIEAFHPQRSAIERLVRRTGYPREAFSQLFEHAELDIQHSRDLDELIDGLPLEAMHEELLAISALGTVEFLTDALLDVFARDGQLNAAVAGSLRTARKHA
jgi:hypothetical protein